VFAWRHVLVRAAHGKVIQSNSKSGSI
jgi:hypothetical protein